MAEGLDGAFTPEEAVARLPSAAHRLAHGARRRRHRGDDGGVRRAPRDRRHDRRRRQRQLQGLEAPPRPPGSARHPLRRRRHLGRRLGPAERLRHDGRRRPRGGRAARAHLPRPRARGRLHPLRPARLGPLHEDGPQRHRVRAHAGLRRGLRDPPRLGVPARPGGRGQGLAARHRHPLLAPRAGRQRLRGARRGPRRRPRLGGRLGRGSLDGAGGHGPRRARPGHHALAPDPLPQPPGGDAIGAQVLAALREQFGGHAIRER